MVRPAVQAEAAAVLAQVDIVGTIESFDASLLLLWEAIGVPPHLGDALGVSKVLAQTYDADKAKWKVPNLPAATKAKFDLYTKCDAAAYAVAVRRMAAQVAAADGGGGGFAARLAKMRAEAKESGVVPLPEHQIRWKPGVLCGAPQGYIGPTTRRLLGAEVRPRVQHDAGAGGRERVGDLGGEIRELRFVS